MSNGEYVIGSYKGQEGYTYIGNSCPTPPSIETPLVCYVNSSTGDYKWTTTSPGSRYEIDYDIKDEAACVPLTETKPACYKDESNNYVWGLHQGELNYTLVEDVLSEKECHERVDVPMTSSDIKTIIYIFVVILLSFGIYVIYYSYTKRKLNK